MISCFCACDPRAVPWETYAWGFSLPLRVLSPSVSPLCMYARVTRLAQRDQIAPIVRATFTQRLLMMDLFRRYYHSTLEAQLTERMLRSILVTDPFPRSPVTPLCPGITPILFILTVHLCLVFRAIPPIRQVGTARISARLLRFPRHLSTFLPIEKAATVFPPQRLPHLSLLPS